MPKSLIAAFGISPVLAALLASVFYLQYSRRGSQLQSLLPLHYLSEMLRMTESSSSSGSGHDNTVAIEVDELELKTHLIAKDEAPNQAEEFMSGEIRHKIIPVAADSTQLEALHILKQLNVIESEVQPNDLCTRREYARWLVKANILLERNAKNMIAPSMLIAGSMNAAFDDVGTEDSDFIYIQAIGEAGMVPSKLSEFLDDNSSHYGKKIDFSPESLLPRIDLISWKAWLDYPLNIRIEEKVPYIQMLGKNSGFSDLSSVTLDASHKLFVDALAGDSSIIRKVFGNIRRLQPQKPVTKAQAAVAITSGRLAEMIHIKISTIEAEYIERMVNKKEIRSELIKKGEIQRNWEQKLCEARSLATNVQEKLSEVLDRLENSKLTVKKETECYLKEKAALDCQKHLLFNLKLEVDKMLEKLDNEKVIVVYEQQTLATLHKDLLENQNATMEAKSILEAEIEALRILRSWVEDGARQSQFRAKVLENAAQRWRWDDQSGSC